MTQEEKELLLQDICGRLPYGVMGLIRIANGNDYNISITGGDIDLLSRNFITIKPYLRHMSSMTEEEKKEYEHIAPGIEIENGVRIPNVNQIEWLNAHHFDYRGLIERGLAIAVTAENKLMNTNKLEWIDAKVADGIYKIL